MGRRCPTGQAACFHQPPCREQQHVRELLEDRVARLVEAPPAARAKAGAVRGKEKGGKPGELELVLRPDGRVVPKPAYGYNSRRLGLVSSGTMRPTTRKRPGASSPIARSGASSPGSPRLRFERDRAIACKPTAASSAPINSAQSTAASRRRVAPPTPTRSIDGPRGRGVPADS